MWSSSNTKWEEEEAPKTSNIGATKSILARGGNTCIRLLTSVCNCFKRADFLHRAFLFLFLLRTNRSNIYRQMIAERSAPELQEQQQRAPLCVWCPFEFRIIGDAHRIHTHKNSQVADLWTAINERHAV